MTVLRMWRAYRDAQLAWVLVPPSLTGNTPCTGGSEDRPDPKGLQQALVIYVPRRGIVEVWPVEQGPCLVRLESCCSRGSLLAPGPHCHAADERQHPTLQAQQSQRQCWLVDWAAGAVLDVGAAISSAAEGRSQEHV